MHIFYDLLLFKVYFYCVYKPSNMAYEDLCVSKSVLLFFNENDAYTESQLQPACRFSLAKLANHLRLFIDRVCDPIIPLLFVGFLSLKLIFSH